MEMNAVHTSRMVTAWGECVKRICGRPEQLPLFISIPCILSIYVVIRHLWPPICVIHPITQAIWDTSPLAILSSPVRFQFFGVDRL